MVLQVLLLMWMRTAINYMVSAPGYRACRPMAGLKPRGHVFFVAWLSRFKRSPRFTRLKAIWGAVYA